LNGAIRISSLSKTYPSPRGLGNVLSSTPSGEVEALRNITLEVARGEIFGLLGPNGGGKTTLLEILASYLLPTSGQVWVNGHDVLRDPLAVRRATGYCPAGGGSFYQRLSGRQNLEFFAVLSHLSATGIRDRIAHLWELVGLDRFRDVAVGRYSDGMRQRLALARALLTDPPILLLDEPTRGIDPVATAFFGRLFRGLAQEQRKTIVLVTHDLRAAAELCDRVAVMDGGRIVEIGSPAAVDAMVRAEP
jgi:ABC-2 type transport system ATP-binding protein